MLASLVGSKEDRAIEIIKSTIGYHLFFYYQYLEFYNGCRPLSIEEMVNGLLYMQAVGKLKELK